MKNQNDDNLKENMEVKDRRLFDADGNIKEEIKTEENEPTLTITSVNQALELLERKTAQAIEQVDATFQQVGNELNALTQQLRTTITDMHVRIGVLEELATNRHLQKDRECMFANEFTIEDFKRIAEEIVLPDIKKKSEEAQIQMKERFDRMQLKVKEGMTPEEAVAQIEEEDKKKEEEPIIKLVD